jgi:hypothetical protein
LADGRAYDVRHEELIIVGPELIHLGVPVPNHPLLLCERTEIIDVASIISVEPLSAVGSSSSA